MTQLLMLMSRLDVREKQNPRQGTRSEVLIMDDMHD